MIPLDHSTIRPSATRPQRENVSVCDSDQGRTCRGQDTRLRTLLQRHSCNEICQCQNQDIWSANDMFWAFITESLCLSYWSLTILLNWFFSRQEVRSVDPVRLWTLNLNKLGLLVVYPVNQVHLESSSLAPSSSCWTPQPQEVRIMNNKRSTEIPNTHESFQLQQYDNPCQYIKLLCGVFQEPQIYR